MLTNLIFELLLKVIVLLVLNVIVNPQLAYMFMGLRRCNYTKAKFNTSDRYDVGFSRNPILVREPSASLSEILHLPEAVDADHALEESARHILCFPLIRIFSLELTEPLKPEEHLALTGSHAYLGEWQIDKSIEMRSLSDSRLEWLAKVPICANSRIYYRYFIYTLDTAQRKQILRWEGQQSARVLESYEIYRQPGIDYFGESVKPALDIGGQEDGWLRFHYVIQLKFLWQRQFKLQGGGVKPITKVLLELLVTSMWSNPAQNTNIEVSRSIYNRSRFQQQPMRGVRYNLEDDIIVFRITESFGVRNSYKLKMYSLERRTIAEISIPSAELVGSEGVLNLPMYSPETGNEVGRLQLPYLIIRPLPHSELLNMRGSFQHYWPMNWPSLDVGHRGLGKSFYDSYAPLAENTINSFLRAYAAKADMVEMDVQLTKDYVPVLWHDFGFHTAHRGVHVQSLNDVDYILVKDLTYKQLKNKRVFVPKGPQSGLREYTHLNVEDSKNLGRIFVKLADVLSRLPKSLGIFLDIKWPQYLQRSDLDLVLESALPKGFDKNLFVNKILLVVGQYGCGRPLILSSFDADICAMLRSKQNLLPVVFSTNGKMNIWQPYKDLRTRNIRSAINFAQSEHLLGTSVHASTFLRNPPLIKLGMNLYQVVFVFGRHLRNSKIIERFRSQHATGLIYDRVDLYGPNDKFRGFFKAPELIEIFQRQCEVPLANASTSTLNLSSSNSKLRDFFSFKIKRLLFRG